MRPKSTNLDLSSSYDVKIHLHNQFVKHMESLKAEITIRNWHVHDLIVLTWLCEGISWKGIDHFRWVVGGHNESCISGNDSPLDRSEGRAVEDASRGYRFQALSGNYGGENLGRYAVGLLDRVGIMDKKGTKVCQFFQMSCVYSACQLYMAMLHNTSNNNMACEAIKDVHVCRGLEWNRHEQQLPWLIFFLIDCFLINLVAAVWRMLSTLATSTLWGTLHRSQPLRMRQRSGNMIQLCLATVF